MSAAAVLNAERIKLTTTRSPLWSAVAVAVLSLGLAAMQASTVYGPGPLEPEKAAMGVAVFGVPVLMILSALTVTNEYRSGLIRTTFMAVPNRTLVLAAKAIVAAAFSSFYAAVMVAASIVVAHSHLDWRLVGGDRALRGAGRRSRRRRRRTAAGLGGRRCGAAAMAAGRRAPARQHAQHQHRGRPVPSRSATPSGSST